MSSAKKSSVKGGQLLQAIDSKCTSTIGVRWVAHMILKWFMTDSDHCSLWTKSLSVLCGRSQTALLLHSTIIAPVRLSYISPLSLLYMKKWSNLMSYYCELTSSRTRWISKSEYWDNIKYKKAHKTVTTLNVIFFLKLFTFIHFRLVWFVS